MIATVEQLRTRYPQTRGLEDATIHARAEDMRAALRARYHVTRADEGAEGAIEDAVRIGFGWWLLAQDRIAGESASTSGASTQYGQTAWPAEFADILAPHSDAPPAPPAASRSVPATFVW